MQNRISATDARIHFGKLMHHVVEKQEPIIVEHSGKPHVVVISIDRYDHLLKVQKGSENWREMVHQAREEVQISLGDRELPPPEEVLRKVREERDAQLMDLH